MTQPTMLDARLRRPRDPDQTSMAIGAVAVLDGAIPGFDEVKAFLAERVRTIWQSAQRLSPQWIDHPGFDLAQQVQRIALPQPGDESELFRAIAHALEQPLDPERAPWECWIIEGLKDNRWAIMLKVHHCMAGDISAVQLLSRLCDDADGPVAANYSASESVSRTSIDKPNWANGFLRASTAVCQAATRAVTWPATLLTPAGPETTRRHYRTVRIARADVDPVCRKFDVGVNDVALAAITEGFRTVLVQRGEEPRADSLRTLDKTDTHVSALLPYLPVEHHDALQQLRTVHGRLHTTPADRRPTLNLSAYLPHTLCAKVIQELVRMHQQRIVTLATNAVGPRRRFWLMGRSVEQLLPIPPTALQLSTGVAVLSYDDELVFGITAGYAAAAEMDQLAAGIELGMSRLVALSDGSVLLFSRGRRKRSTRASGRGVQRRASTQPVRART